MPKNTVSTAIIRASVLGPLVRSLDGVGRTDALLAAHGLSRQGLADPYAPIPLARYVALFEAAAMALSDPLIGLKLGLAVRPADLGPLGLLFTAAPTPRLAVTRLCDLLSALQGGTQAALQRKEAVTVWTYRIDDDAIWPRRLKTRHPAAAICGLLRAIAGASLRPAEVAFEHDGPPGSAAHERLLQAPVIFGQAANRMTFGNAELDRALPSANPGLALVLERHVADLMRGPETDADLIQSVRRLIGAQLGQERITIERLAAGLGLSPRTLQRRLGESGTSVRALLREHRLAMADLRMGSSGLSQSDIAEALGYADGTAFWRAFKSWTNTTPSAFRREKTTGDARLRSPRTSTRRS
jgi:AraC-like DNA-binding protein